MLLTVVFFANDTVVKDDSHLCIARLLAPIVAKMEDRGSLLSVQEVVEELGDDAVRLRYGWVQDGVNKRVGIFEQEKSEDVGIRAVGLLVKRHQRRFPEGKYD